MTLLWPIGLVLLLVVPLLVAAYAVAQRRRRPAGLRYSSVSLVREAIQKPSRVRRHLPFALFAASVGALAIAGARPAAMVSVPANQATIILALDVSGSMCSTDIAPSRLLAAEAAAAQYIESQASSTQIGIVAFSGFAESVQPATSDKSLLLSALQSLTTGRRTAIGSGLLGAIDAINAADPNVPASTSQGRPGAEPTPGPAGTYVPDIIVLLTDGVSNTGPAPLDAAQQAVDRGIRVYTIGFGSADGGALDPQCAQQFIGREPGGQGFGGGGFGGGGGGGGGGAFRRGIDEQTLQQIADMTGGTYHPAESAGQLQSVFRSLPTSLIFKTQAADVGVVFVAIAGIWAALAFLLGRAWRPLP
jgi:Ca-activated chloride channel homolog